VDECRELLGRGVRELCLIGQDIAAYTPSLGALLENIARLPGSFWVRLLYLHPDHFPRDILPIMERDGRFLPYFDIPFQHGSSRILAAMGRTGNAPAYLDLLETIRRRLPGAVIRSTFLVGFPGETEEDFEALLDFQQRARFDWLGVFAWSREEGTAAFSMKGRVAKKTALARKARIEAAQIPITEERADRFTGRTMDMLIEEAIPSEQDGANLWLGRLLCHAPEVDGAAILRTEGPPPPGIAPGAMIRARVIRRAGFDLELRAERGRP
jgi:ribosomal protein S12 methylthiotransferase